jgi:hypothetical protein
MSGYASYNKPAVEVDLAGLRRKFAHRQKSFLIYELLQNAWDEAEAEVTIDIEPLPGRPLCKVRVEDDSPEGFKNLAHAYTMFADSSKAENPEKRGIWNLGEKLVIAFSREASIITTKGSVYFADGKRKMGRKKRDRGTVFEGLMEITRKEYAEIEEALGRLIPPHHLKTTFNGEELTGPKAVTTFTARLPTTIGDDEGVRPTTRLTHVSLYKADGPAFIYEMGIPVVELEGGDPYHIEVMQRVPLNMNRDNVTPAFRKRLRGLVLENMVERVPDEEIGSGWVREALTDKEVTPETAGRVAQKEHGEDALVATVADPESRSRALEKGHNIVPSNAYPKEVWEKIRESGAIETTGKLYPTPSPFTDDPDAPELQYVPMQEWTPEQEIVAIYAQETGAALLGFEPVVRIAKLPSRGHAWWQACWDKRSRTLTFSQTSLGKAWFDRAVNEDLTPLNDLLIHEFAHSFEGDHLSEEYHKAATRLGAKLVQLALEKPELFDLRSRC